MGAERIPPPVARAPSLFLSWMSLGHLLTPGPVTALSSHPSFSWGLGGEEGSGDGELTPGTPQDHQGTDTHAGRGG